jgi:hypothetical protein
MGEDDVPMTSAPSPLIDGHTGTSTPRSPFSARCTSFVAIVAVAGACWTTTPAIARR